MFAQKDRLIDNTLSALQEKCGIIDDRIARAKSEVLVSEEELDDSYTAKRFRLQKRHGYLTEEGRRLEGQYDSELAIRKQAVRDKLDGSVIPQLESEKAEIDRDIALTRTKSLKDLITRENADSVFSVAHTNEVGEVNEFREIKSSDYFALIKFLIWNGYIDETYMDYMTYFYDESISANDKTFLRRITDRRGAEYTYALREPQKIVESPILRVVEFEQEETLNFDLLECLLLNETAPKYAQYLKALISQMRMTQNFDFVSKYYDTGRAREQFVIRLNEQWEEFFYLALQDESLPAAQIRQFSIDTLHYYDMEKIETINIDNCLSEYISNSTDYLAIAQPNKENLISGLIIIGVLFSSIDYESANKDLLHEVYRHSLYALTFENISLMLRKKYGIESDFDIVHKNYTLVQSQGGQEGQERSPLATYVFKNMSTYAEIMLNNCNGSITDDEVVAIRFLNNENVDYAHKKRYIELLSTGVTEITQVTDPTLWATMISSGIVAFSVTNFINYFLEHGIDTTLAEYINDSPPEDDFAFIRDVFEEETAERLFDATVVCNGIDTEKYRKILLGLGYYFDNYYAAEISDDKFMVLIDDGILQMDAEGLKFVREKYEKHIFPFIHQNLNEYLTLLDADTFNLAEALQIMMLDIDDDKKIKLISFANEPITIVDKGYSDAVNAYIIGHNLDAEDKPHVYANYSHYGEKARTAIVALAIERASEIISYNMCVDDSLLSILFQEDNLTRDQKIKLFTMAVPTLYEDTFKAHFDELGLSDLKGIFAKSGGRRNYVKSSDVTTILDALKLNSWIYDYRDDERNTDRYTVIKNRPRSKGTKVLD